MAPSASWLLVLLPYVASFYSSAPASRPAIGNHLRNVRLVLVEERFVSQSLRARREALWREMEAPDKRRQPDGEAIDDPSAPLALCAVRAADDRKAIDITALRVSHLTSATTFFINMAGRSKAQISAIVKSIEDEVLQQFGYRSNRQGKARGGWVCLDYDSVVVNIFSEESREFYGIDKYWAAAQPLDLSGVLTPDAPDATPDAAAADADDVDDWELGEDDDWTLSLDDEWSASKAAANGAVTGAVRGASSKGPGGRAAAAAAAAAAAEEEEEEEEEELLGAIDVNEAINWDSHPANQRAVPFDFSVRPTAAAEAVVNMNEIERAAMKGASWEVELRFSDDGEEEEEEEEEEEASFLLDEADDDLFADFASEMVKDELDDFVPTIATEEEEEAMERELVANGLLIEVDGDDEDEDWAMGDEQLRAIVERAEMSANRNGESSVLGDWRSMMAEDGWADIEDTLEKTAAEKTDGDAEEGFFQ